MIQWLKETPERRLQIIRQVNAQTGFSQVAIEKDWWVTLALLAVTRTEWIPNIVFKGGTSLSKGWRLTTRFSEDVDLAMDRSVLGFDNSNPIPSQVNKLRHPSATFMAGRFRDGLEAQLREIGLQGKEIKVLVKDGPSNEDPKQIWLLYNSLYVTEERGIHDWVKSTFFCGADGQDGNVTGADKGFAVLNLHYSARSGCRHLP